MHNSAHIAYICIKTMEENDPATVVDGWEKRTTQEGKQYFINLETGFIQWDMPQQVVTQS